MQCLLQATLTNTSLLPSRLRGRVEYVGELDTEPVPLTCHQSVAPPASPVAASKENGSFDDCADGCRATEIVVNTEEATTQERLQDSVIAQDPTMLDDSTAIVVSDGDGTLYSSATMMAQAHSARELREMAMRYGVAQHGKKIEICERIMQALSPDAAAA